MATDATRKKHGTMPCEGSRCPSHDRKIPVVVFRNSKGTLSYSCDWCGRAPYAKEGTGQHEEWTQEITQFGAAAAPVVKPAPAAPVIETIKQKGGLSWMA